MFSYQQWYPYKNDADLYFRKGSQLFSCNNPKKEIDGIDLTVKQNNLYLEEAFTDLDMATIRRLTPVKPNGMKDKSRKSIFVGNTQLMTPHGPLPVRSLLKAKNLKEAMEEYPSAMKKAIEKMLDELNKMQQEQESRIIVPGSDSGSGSLIR